MLRSRNEVIEMERLIIESAGGAREVAKQAQTMNNPCLLEAVEWWQAEEEELKTLRQFKDATKDRINGALEEAEEKFLSELAEILSWFKEIKLADPDPNKEKEATENLLSPAMAYDKNGKTKVPKSVNEARKRALLWWRRKFILEWLIKQS